MLAFAVFPQVPTDAATVDHMRVLVCACVYVCVVLAFKCRVEKTMNDFYTTISTEDEKICQRPARRSGVATKMAVRTFLYMSLLSYGNEVVLCTGIVPPQNGRISQLLNERCLHACAQGTPLIPVTASVPLRECECAILK